jgi:hypothetical protein
MDSIPLHPANLCRFTTLVAQNTAAASVPFAMGKGSQQQQQKHKKEGHGLFFWAIVLVLPAVFFTYLIASGNPTQEVRVWCARS